MQITQPITSSDVVYLIMPDRFACSDKALSDRYVDRTKESYWHGGNIRGLIDHLDYISDLGVTAIWLTPILENNNPIEGGIYTSYHGYGITNFECVDPHLGTKEDYKELVEKAHSLGLKVIFDFVMNHCGIGHNWLEYKPGWINRVDSYEAPRTTNYNTTPVLGAYSSLFDIETTVKGWFTPNMPDINLANPEVLKYFKDVIDDWIEECNFDAIRLDTYQYSDGKAMQEWQQHIYEKHPGVSIIAETWVPIAAYTAEVQKKCDVANNLIVMDFAFQKAIEKAFSRKKGLEQERALYDHFACDFLYNDARKTLAFLDNHDLVRWFFKHKNIDQAKQAIGILLTVPRIPQILYGTEIMSSGDNKGNGDGNWRNDFPGGWKEDEVNMFTQEGRHTNEIIDDFWSFVQRLLTWRKTSQAVINGKMVQFLPQNGVYVYSRFTENERIIVIVNLSKRMQYVDLKRYSEILGDCHVGLDVVSDKEIYLTEGYIEIKKNNIIILETIHDTPN